MRVGCRLVQFIDRMHDHTNAWINLPDEYPLHEGAAFRAWEASGQTARSFAE